MLYRLRRKLDLRRFNREIAPILQTRPIQVVDGPCTVVSMVANRDVPMYVAALKSFYPKLGFGKVVAIIDRDMPQHLRYILAYHIAGIKFEILEDIQTAPCQSGGTWERLLFCLDRSEQEYTIQVDADTLCVGETVDEVIACVRANRAFTMADGFARQTLREAAAMAEATPSDYIGMAVERALARYPGSEALHYIRGSSGFVGFALGGYTRAEITVFHQTMEKLVGETRWREWGSEQCGSNFAVANSPNPVVLPYPEYASFNGKVLRHRAKLFHFIGRFRFLEGYLARRTQEVIARLTPGARPIAPPPPVTTTARAVGPLPFAFTRHLEPSSFLPYLQWRLGGRTHDLQVRIAGRREFRSDGPPGPKLQLRGTGAGNNDYGVAYEIFVETLLFPPVWIPPERVQTIVDVGANVGMSCLWWLSNYWRARVIAFEPHPEHARQAQTNLALNNWTDQAELHQAAAGTHPGRATLSNAGSSSSLLDSSATVIPVEVVDLFAILSGRHIDILKVDIEGGEVGLLEDHRFGGLDVDVVVMEWHKLDAGGRGGRDWCRDRLEAKDFRTYVTQERGPTGILWGYRGEPWGRFSVAQ
jgi:FkbM family methyltransferase